MALHLIASSLPLLSCNSQASLARDTSQSEEERVFPQLAQEINVIQDSLLATKPQNVVLRGFHAKSHGCLKGKLVVLPLSERHIERKFEIDPGDTLFGIFAKEHEYDILARFSNGVGFIQADAWSDVRGLAVKVLEVEGKRVSPQEADSHPEQHTQDFLMTNNPTQLASTAQDFMKFGKTQDSMTSSAWFLTKKLRSMKILLFGLLFRNVDSLVNDQYWSDAPINLGEKPIKYTAQPCTRNPNPNPVRRGDNRLTEDLRRFSFANPICFNFRVQFQLDEEKQPTEDALTEWEEEDTPFVTVAQIRFPPQRLKQTQGCESLRFTPWHALKEHEPIGNMNRGRSSVYESSQRHRAALHEEPDLSTIDRES